MAHHVLISSHINAMNNHTHNVIHGNTIFYSHSCATNHNIYNVNILLIKLVYILTTYIIAHGYEYEWIYIFIKYNLPYLLNTANKVYIDHNIFYKHTTHTHSNIYRNNG